MDAERWAGIETIVLAALERDPLARGAFLDEACGGDSALRAEVDGLIASHEDDPNFLLEPLPLNLSVLGIDARDADALPEGTWIGPYRLIRRLGQGGMGEVYLAERALEDFNQRVALKVVRPGKNTEEVIRRFGQERRILASLTHPNIAALLDASTTPDGRPYFVMEYVEGIPVDEYCRVRELPVRERLELFQAICGAVQHAHQKLVVHRDIKPRNILVTDGGVPKLLDFGIGKVLGETNALSRSTDTRTLLRLLTPEYASPEQVSGGVITAATDVYGLGVLLYVLLTGSHPYLQDDDTLQEAEHAIVGRHPRRPSEIVGSGETRRRLAGDIDTIVLKALRKEPERRYPTAAALADDIERHLVGLPVRARPDTLGYRARKFARRNAAWISTSAVAGLALVTVTGVTFVQSQRVALEAERTLKERDMALEVRAFLMEIFGGSGAVGDTVTARQLLDLQAEMLPGAYVDRPEVRVEMMEVLADGYDRLGLYHEAEALAREALELRRATASPSDPALAASLNLYGWIVHELGRSGEAEALLREAAAISRHKGAGHQLTLARSLNDLGVVLDALNRHDEAEIILREALELRQAGLGENPRSVGITASNLAATYYYQGSLERAVPMQEHALGALRASLGVDHPRTIIAEANLAAFRLSMDDWAGASEDYRNLLERQVRLQRRDHPVTARLMRSLGVALHGRGLTEGDAGLLREAESLYLEALAILESALGAEHPDVELLLGRLNRTRAVLDSLEGR